MIEPVTDLIAKITGCFSGNQYATALNSFCSEKYDSTVSIFIGMDENNPPDPESDYPIITLSDIQDRMGDESGERIVSALIGIGIIQPATTRSGSVFQYDGFVECERLRELVQDCLQTIQYPRVAFRSASAHDGSYPLFVSFTLAEFKYLRSNRNRI